MVIHRIDQAAVIAALRGAAPYIRLYKGKTFVIRPAAPCSARRAPRAR
jgi:hypothetical protein